MAVPVKLGSTVEAGQPVELFQTHTASRSFGWLLRSATIFVDCPFFGQRFRRTNTSYCPDSEHISNVTRW